MSRIRAWSSPAAGQPLELAEYDLGPLGSEEVEVEVEHCGICHSDLSVLENEWKSTHYPVVPGHEVIGRVVAMGANAKGLREGQRVGVGWNAGSCMHCRACLSGDQHLCPVAQATIVGHHGGFAERVRAHWAWAIPIPERLEPAAAGPLLCGGVTVFSPLVDFAVRPTQRAGVVGIGGLGHMALQFLGAWGCEVTAFTSSKSKFDEAKQLGADHVVSSRDSDAIEHLAGKLDLLLVTVNVPLDWNALISTLNARGRMHLVGAVLEPIPVYAFDLIAGLRSVSGSPTGPPTTIAEMLDFAARHSLAPQIERFPMSRANEALDHLRAGKARYRIVLDADWS
ncbi:NADPH-dependent aldehyde reductase Ahr [Candidatus Laterigemmans baculatus]|uniref:NADPH-dependent aldehyde reductase Ahr n=1 Tax=Candidatus Laterigemmans baculatus TaxID=2770505 RepID=UPI0013DD55F0|nr:NAD(P)-dependent alcohol dehydrogenase [Candidatus Laterigemmans baculatus]